MESLAQKLTNYIIKQGVISKNDYAIYKYGLQTGLEMETCVLVNAFISIYLNSFFLFLVFIFIFFPLRAYVGGIHMKYFYSCFFCSCAVIILGIIFANIVKCENGIIFFSMLIMMVSIHKLAYLTTKGQSEYDEILYYGLQRKKILVGIGILACLSLGMHLQKIFNVSSI